MEPPGFFFFFLVDGGLSSRLCSDVHLQGTAKYLKEARHGIMKISLSNFTPDETLWVYFKAVSRSTLSKNFIQLELSGPLIESNKQVVIALRTKIPLL
mmetsp:Transcript_2890/g.4145  ORF Transcript_2890/g.4145 Transcript_2890/m.4145 type:complete len:98 (-) Transcript_2890:36-329(-)